VVAGRALCRALEAGDRVGIARGLFNRLQPTAERLQPIIADLDARLAALGPAGRLMSGSGTTLFALCRDHAEAQRVAGAMRLLSREKLVSRVHVVRSCF
jgi:4-diphosphocytidyl-2-C-methyl-D-erythritol kinase